MQQSRIASFPGFMGESKLSRMPGNEATVKDSLQNGVNIVVNRYNMLYILK